MEEKLDTMRTVETPEGVELTLRAAGPTSRILAWILDQLVRIVVYFFAGIGLSFLGHLGMGLLSILVFLLEWFYPVYFEVYRFGSTPGKSALGLTVVNDDGTPVDFSRSFIRNALRVADFLPFFYLIGLTTMVLNRDFKRLGDIVGGTVVVYKDRPVVPAKLAPAVAVPVSVPLGLSEQRAIIDFAERAPGLSRDRAFELAEVIEPLAGSPAPIAAKRLLGMAHWLSGKR